MPAVHQKLTRTSRGLHQSYVEGFTRRAVILKESRGQHPQTQNHFFKTMTTFNTDYNNTELLDQELTIEQLEAVAGGILPVIVAGTAAWIVAVVAGEVS